ncbi:MAG: putative quinol monooxygenase [Hyphomonadaceae bacterium]
MIGVVARIKVKPGSQADFEAVVKQLVAAVNANEAGCRLYQCFKVQDSEVDYLFMEEYDDVAATEAHRASDHFRTFGRQMGAFMDGPPEIIRTLKVS